MTKKHEGFYTCSAFSGGKTVKSLPTLILIDANGQGSYFFVDTNYMRLSLQI